MKNNTLISIVGPTAIGKTALSVQLAQQLNCEIISADSRQFYKEMNIGTAKVTKEEMKEIPHHFVDFLSVSEFYSAGQFEKDVLKKLEELFKKNSQVIMVGGSGLYVNAVLHGIDEIPSDLKVREKLNQEVKNNGLEYLLLQLKTLDYEHYTVVDKQNPQRVIRALEVCIASGKKYSDFRLEKHKNRTFNSIQIGLCANRELLYDRINQRVDQMMQQGLLEEVKNLLPYKELNSLNTVGYKELFAYLDGECELNFAIEKIKQNTRNFAKRQLTWFRKDKKTRWFDRFETEKISKYLHSIS